MFSDLCPGSVMLLPNGARIQAALGWLRKLFLKFGTFFKTMIFI